MISHIPQFDATRDDKPFKDTLKAKAAEVIESGVFILGPEVAAFEKEVATYLGVKHAWAVSSGTDALVLALMALDIGPGDEVICPTYTFFATAGSVARLGATPVFVDSSPCCFNIAMEGIRRAISPRTKAIMPVHLFGQCADMGLILSLAAEKGIAVVEDAAQAIGATYQGKKAGSLGDIGCFSFYPTKTLGGFGEGGLVTTQRDDLAERMRVLRNHGMAQTYEHLEVGGNFRMHALQGALLRLRLPRLPGLIAARRRHAQHYLEGFTSKGLGAYPVDACACASPMGSEASSQCPLLLPFTCNDPHTFNQFCLRVTGGKRDALKAHLAGKGIGTGIYYPKPLHRQPCFEKLGPAGFFPNAETFSREALALPMFAELRDEEVQAVLEAIYSFYH
ncbi:MAG: DegT/DnrJ/EryC1/StrS family aminotransferase [Candidatus Methylacidiphilales bacterium]|nr:DegT/DnrJ/EryC1/StrS family aminotransferase [Candidatus Methylacidiphilales bacterium]